MTTEKGLYCRTGDTTIQWTQEAAHAIVIDARGQTWVGTDNGLIQVTQHGVQPVSTAADGHIVRICSAGATSCGAVTSRDCAA